MKRALITVAIQYVLAAVGVAALVFAAYLIYTHAQVARLNMQPQTPEPMPVESGSKSDQPVFEHVEPARVIDAGNGQLSIAELGVALPAQGILRDLVAAQLIVYETPEIIYGLSTRSLMKLVPTYSQGNCQPENSPLGALELSDTGATMFDSTIVVKLSNGKFLMWTSPQDRCTAEPGAEELYWQQLEAVRAAVRQAVVI